MNRIQVLPNQVVDQIAAGEVVERPAQLVKELIENAMDAAATEIFVEIKEGGRNVTVTDNGGGIHPEDIEKALQRFATSKIVSGDDLWKLQSFGFRGEALASAAAISRLSISSRIAGQNKGCKIRSEFGYLSEPTEVSHSQGTTVFVENLFENVPARLKFLKSASSEQTQIRQTIKALALSSPQIAFKLTVEGVLVEYFPIAKDRSERANQVLGMTLYWQEHQRGSIQVAAAFGDPYSVAKTSKNIWVLAQNRWIQDRSIQTAVIESYRNLLMHGEYPQAVIWVNVDPETIDVNIHPTKAQVKFQSPSDIFRAVHECLRSALEKGPWRSKHLPPVEGASPMPTPMGFQSEELDRSQFKKLNFELAAKAVSVAPAFGDLPSPSKAVTDPADAKTSGQWSALEVLGQSHLTYLICQSREGLVLVDQHAAHERVIFEKLMSSWKNKNFEVQNFLFPLTLDFTADLVEAFLNNAATLNQMGIQIEQMGPQSIGIKSAPAFLKESSIVAVFEKFGAEMRDLGGSFQIERKIADVFASMACHSAIRAGQAMSPSEMKALLSEMDESPLSSFCPHGRPVSVTYPVHEIERDFGRIV